MNNADDFDTGPEFINEDEVKERQFYQRVDPPPKLNWFQRWRLQRVIHKKKYCWRALSIGGGANFATPPLVRAKAIEYICGGGKGTLVHVDDVNKVIVFKSR